MTIAPPKVYADGDPLLVGPLNDALAAAFAATMSINGSQLALRAGILNKQIADRYQVWSPGSDLAIPQLGAAATTNIAGGGGQTVPVAGAEVEIWKHHVALRDSQEAWLVLIAIHVTEVVAAGGDWPILRFYKNGDQLGGQDLVIDTGGWWFLGDPAIFVDSPVVDVQNQDVLRVATESQGATAPSLRKVTITPYFKTEITS